MVRLRGPTIISAQRMQVRRLTPSSPLDSSAISESPNRSKRTCTGHIRSTHHLSISTYHYRLYPAKVLMDARLPRLTRCSRAARCRERRHRAEHARWQWYGICVLTRVNLASFRRRLSLLLD